MLLSSIWIAFSSPATAAGQPSEAEVAQAQAQYEEGLALMEQALYAEALERFQTSYTMMEGHPNQPLILFQVARAHQEIGSRCLSIGAYERFLASDVTEFRADAERRLRNVRAEAEASGLSCEGGSIAPVGPIVMTVGGLTILGGVVTGILALNAEGQLAAACSPDRVCPPNEFGTLDDYETFRTATDILLVAGLVVTAGGLLLTLFLREGGGGESTERVAFGGACTGEGCAVHVGARF